MPLPASVPLSKALAQGAHSVATPCASPQKNDVWRGWVKRGSNILVRPCAQLTNYVILINIMHILTRYMSVYGQRLPLLGRRDPLLGRRDMYLVSISIIFALPLFTHLHFISSQSGHAGKTEVLVFRHLQWKHIDSDPSDR